MIFICIYEQLFFCSIAYALYLRSKERSFTAFLIKYIGKKKAEAY
ncbi:hypothetical protein HMPREF9444_01264 [Succinatimonas hippei YIT 12066]|uniref:Uncharacterized protein n=1 Tax=Succinatimonas hippei (strain DSM 22608 / JCM 16073 / KCTC 15190 / YIT 12066) TaxID=762983 RepID=E8LKM3_SUCHY|nr:hypothetical protein HMPREF9444_01264 [Succinatimonas hippei YIT 12066]